MRNLRKTANNSRMRVRERAGVVTFSPTWPSLNEIVNNPRILIAYPQQLHTALIAEAALETDARRPVHVRGDAGVYSTAQPKGAMGEGFLNGHWYGFYESCVPARRSRKSSWLSRSRALCAESQPPGPRRERASTYGPLPAGIAATIYHSRARLFLSFPFFSLVWFVGDR